MDSRIVFTVERDRFWRSITTYATQCAGRIHGSPPEIAIEVGHARLYISEVPIADEEVPAAARALGSTMLTFVVDVHNALEADAFLAEALRDVPGVIDDDDGNVVATDAFIGAARGLPSQGASHER
jgi:hypothetical protein